jgi:hypothetical protein
MTDPTLCVVVFAIGSISYKSDSKAILSDYFKRHAISYKFIEEAPAGIDMKGSHPSWWKLMVHSIVPGYDFIICWDLDLLPRDPHVEVLHEFHRSSLCFAWDSHAKHFPTDKFRPSFKYNGGLMGIPASYADFMKSIFLKYAPGTYPSYEQYYLNDELETYKIPVHELPADINVLYSFSEFPSARLQHYTYKHEAKSKIHSHYEQYFGIQLFDTRLDMIRALVSPKGNLCEIGIFKGTMAKQIEPALDPSLFVLIDYFEGNMGSGDQDGNNFEFVDLGTCYRELTNYFKAKSSVVVMKGDSVTSMNTYPDQTFDAIYIDGDHSYEGCKRDLETAFRKIKKGGYIMGHDYEMNMKKATREYFFGVKQAVDEFCQVYKQSICAKGLDGCVSYAIRII